MTLYLQSEIGFRSLQCVDTRTNTCDVVQRAAIPLILFFYEI